MPPDALTDVVRIAMSQKAANFMRLSRYILIMRKARCACRRARAARPAMEASKQRSVRDDGQNRGEDEWPEQAVQHGRTSDLAGRGQLAVGSLPTDHGQLPTKFPRAKTKTPPRGRRGFVCFGRL